MGVTDANVATFVSKAASYTCFLAKVVAAEADCKSQLRASRLVTRVSTAKS